MLAKRARLAHRHRIKVLFVSQSGSWNRGAFNARVIWVESRENVSLAKCIPGEIYKANYFTTKP